MALSDRQIERYSRQIIVPGVGGIGQERLLAAKVGLIGEPGDVEAPLAYLVGAGIGTIFVMSGGSAIDLRVIDDLSGLNPNSRVITGAPSAPIDLLLAIIGSEASLETTRLAIDSHAGRPAAIARLDLPPWIASLGASPCPLCADVELLGGFGKKAEQAEFVEMLATAAAIATLAGNEPAAPRLIEFEGYDSRSLAIARRAVNRCRCETPGRADA
jgi:hypothetical protein